jgi:hypothetical protein
LKTWRAAKGGGNVAVYEWVRDNGRPPSPTRSPRTSDDDDDL